MRIEGHHRRAPAVLRRPGASALDHLPVPGVDTVERAEGDRPPVGIRRDLIEAPVDFHQLVPGMWPRPVPEGLRNRREHEMLRRRTMVGIAPSNQ